MRYSYNKIEKGQIPRRNLTQDQIERLEEIGFKWSNGNSLIKASRRRLSSAVIIFKHSRVSLGIVMLPVVAR